MKKKSQIVAYIAIAFIFLILGALLIFRISLVVKEAKTGEKKVEALKSDPKTDAIYLIKKCIRIETEKALYLAAKQGNTINLTKWKNNNHYIYWFYWNNFNLSKDGSFKFKKNSSFYYYPVFIYRIPSLEDLRKELEPYLLKKIKECVNDFREVRTKYDVSILSKFNNLSVVFYNKSVKVSLDYFISIYNPKTNSIFKRENNLIEEINIPYKEDFLTLEKLFNKVEEKGLYGFYLIFLSGLSDKIPYGIFNYSCNKPMKINVNTIKEEFQFLINHSDNICYYNCKYTYNPYNSFEKDLDIYLPNYYNFYTKFHKIKYFDAYLRFDSLAKNRYKDNYNEKKGSFLIFNPITAKEYTGLDMDFEGNKICSGNVYYDLIVNGSLMMIDNRLRNPLVFQFGFDTGLMNNRPITLAASFQKNNSLQFYYINRSNFTFKLWPRRAENVYFDDWRKPYINYKIDLNLRYKLANFGQIRDVWLKIDKDKVDNLKNRIPEESSIFCLPFFYKKYNNDSIPLAIYCSDGTIFLKNNNYSALIDIKKFHTYPFYKNNLPELLYIKNFNSLPKNPDAPKEFLENFGKKEEYNIYFLPINKQIIDIFNNENLTDDSFLEYKFNYNMTISSILAPQFFNPDMEKITEKLFLGNISNLYNHFIKEETTIYYNNISNTYFKLFIKKYTYGSSLSFIGLNKTTNFTKQLIIKDYNNVSFSHQLIPIVIFGTNRSITFKKKYNNNLILPVVYDYYNIFYNENLTKAYAFFNALITIYTQNFNWQSSFSLLQNFNNINNYIDGLIKALDNYKVNNVNLSIKDKVPYNIYYYIKSVLLQSKHLCINAKNKEELKNCIMKNLDYLNRFKNGLVVENNNFLVYDNETIQKKMELLKPKNNIYKDDVKKFQDCLNVQLLNNIDYNKALKQCSKFINDEINFNTKQFLEFLANPLNSVAQKDLILNIQPYFGKKEKYKVNVNTNLDKFKEINDFRQIVITKAVCNTDNGKKTIYLSNYGLKNFEKTVYLPLNCNFITKLIAYYREPKINNKLNLLIDNNLKNTNYWPYIQKVVNYLYFYNKNNIKISFVNENQIINNLKDNTIVLLYSKDSNLLNNIAQIQDSINKVNNLTIINLDSLYYLPYSEKIDSKTNQKYLVKYFNYYSFYNGNNLKNFLDKTLFNNSILQLKTKKIVQTNYLLQSSFTIS